MWNKPEHDQFAEELFLAGQRVPAGPYRQVGSAFYCESVGFVLISSEAPPKWAVCFVRFNTQSGIRFTEQTIALRDALKRFDELSPQLQTVGCRLMLPFLVRLFLHTFDRVSVSDHPAMQAPQLGTP
jgi:hypothetical protein